ncbi:GAF domain-containing hybrid sensor histidine kinase/response regulator [[Phormidium] sp. ETS-05]|uniref:GAF domain-containing hybrid sensor histidine kinase/response regulator n=1 Tax=[Phormidium] sp. ETS-05 TaxID=222819 RepID=UPI001E4E6EA2|nr:GAF domain-containing hybrid sensor histidine kinase/response regulator [[Phormidium] sp. ETS-05]
MEKILEIMAAPLPQPEPNSPQPVLTNPVLDTSYASISICQPVESALQLQIEQGRLLNQVTAQIRQSLELPVILSTAVEQVRRFLQVDRLVIYEFNHSQPEKTHNTEGGPTSFGRITYESRAADTIPSVLHWQEGVNCFIDDPKFIKKYRKGSTLAIEDVETAYLSYPCLLKLMHQAGVRAKLVVPLVVNISEGNFEGEFAGDADDSERGKPVLWGLLIAHQCSGPRPWLEMEKDFLIHIGDHLSLGIQQALLYARLQEEKENLERRVRARTQELRDALLAAESASRAKSEFLATISHELRTPLTCVIGMSSTLMRWPVATESRKGNGTALSHKQRDYLQTIYDSGKHLLHLIEDIIDLSHLEAGKTVLQVRQFSLCELANRVIQGFLGKAASRDVTLTLNLAIPDGDDRFTADPNRVEQILDNLLSNAIKFTPQGGRVELSVWLENKTAAFQVEDTGVGIPEEQQPLLFQIFQQLDGTHRRNYGGMGVGLALTKQLVELHGGWIGVKSKLGKGSIFTVRLPAQSFTPSVQGSEARIPPQNYSAPLGCIVLIESSEDSATEICEILNQTGYQVVWMLDGSSAREQIDLLQPKVAIVNIRLAGMDGGEIITSLRKSSANPHLKILALAPPCPPAELLSILESGADDYAIKPLELPQLLSQINTLVARVDMELKRKG